MDVNKIEKLRAIAQKQVETANSYANVRLDAATAESELKIIVTSRLKELRGTKRNLGIEMAILMVCEEDEHARDLYHIWVTKEALYKGLEKLLDAQGSQLIFEQSIMKFQGNGEKWGA